MNDAGTFALVFAHSLAMRDYARAYGMASRGYCRATTLEQMQAAFEAIVPLDWGPIGPIEIGYTMTNWPDRQPADQGWFYVSIGGDVYSEGVTVIVAMEEGQLRIREIEWGRP